MRFWDSSAIVPAVVRESASSAVTDLLEADPAMTVWVATAAEIESAVWRRDREGSLGLEERLQALRDLGILERSWTVVLDAPLVVRRARPLLGLHPLRPVDALQLGAALVACDEEPGALPFVTLDDRLADAARREGFPVLLPA